MVPQSIDNHPIPAGRLRLQEALRCGMTEGAHDGGAWRNPHDDADLGTAWAYGFFLGRGERPPFDVNVAARRLELTDIASDLEGELPEAPPAQEGERLAPTYDPRDVEHMRALKEAGFSKPAVAKLTGATPFGVSYRLGPFPRRSGSEASRCVGLRDQMALVRETGLFGRIADVHLGPGGGVVASLELADGRVVLELTERLVVGGRRVA